MIPRKLQILFAIIAIIGGSIILMLLFKGMKKKPKQRTAKITKIFVHATTVKYHKIIPMIREGGRLGSQNKVDIISEVQGQLLKGDIRLKKGGRFKKGDLLAQVFDEEAKNNLMALKSRFLNTLVNALPDLKIDYPNIYPNWLAFYKNIDITKDLPELPQLTSNKEKTFLASRNILNNYFTIKSAEIRLKKYAIKAPFNGSFTKVNLEIGSTINPGGRLGTIIQTNKLELEVPVKAQDIQWLKIGDKVTVSRGNTEDKLSGKIVRIADFIQAKTQSVSVFINIKPQSKVKLLAGMYLNANFMGKAIDNVMEIPRNAVFNDNMVFIVDKGKLKKAIINVQKVNEKTLLFSGLKEGEKVVSEPLVNVSEGMNVEIIK
jgi:multidrug efflux pump subunit AcrA (membrane-fusion protein)